MVEYNEEMAMEKNKEREETRKMKTKQKTTCQN